VGCRLVPPRPDNPFLRNTSTIEAGQVFTIEPGCYFIDSLLDELRQRPVAATFDWDLVAELAHFGGVRIEDNIAVLERGIANLTRDNWTAAT
jgi:Xaa-Pro dipeptidase